MYLFHHVLQAELKSLLPLQVAVNLKYEVLHYQIYAVCNVVYLYICKCVHTYASINALVAVSIHNTTAYFMPHSKPRCKLCHIMKPYHWCM